MAFTHLHVHSEYSLLDGMCKLPDLTHRAREMGMDALALTDHGVLYGAIQFYLAAKDAGIKPILGMEGYVAPGDHRSKTSADRDPYHIVLLAKNETGWRNLIHLATKAQVDGFYYKPRMDHELLAQHSEGIAVLSGCLNAEVPRLILDGRMDEAANTAKWYKDVFGDYFFELQNHKIPELDQVNKGLVELSKQLGIPLAATNDSHYVHEYNSYAHDVLLCIQTNSNIYEEKRLKLADESFYLKSPQEMAALFADYPDALAQTARIADLCDVSIDFSKVYLPEYSTPQGQNPDHYLAELCRAGLRRRYPEVTEVLERRLQYELDVILKTQFANYFLVVWDIVNYAKQQGILYGVRGSAAASLVLYCLGITEIDPISTKLVFERFLNIERKEMPDIDMDFADNRRDEMISYVAHKYGYDHVAQIITFGTLGAKAAIRDVARGLGLSYGDGDRVARLVPAALHMTLNRAMEENPELETLYKEDETVKHLMDTAIALEGTARHASTHAAGVLISKEPLTGLVPLQRPNRSDENAILTTQWPMEEIAKIGLLKMDFLGLINLTILGRARDSIKETQGVEIDLLKLPLDDAKTYELLSEGETTGVFQLESPGMRRYVKELKPQSVAELAAMVALYRPGPMQHIPTYIEARHGRAAVQFPHPALADILEDTYGVIVYQDQVLLILQHFAGYSLGHADIVRKAMGKKIRELMQAEKAGFIKGAEEKGFTRTLAEEVFELIEPFAGYAFNKAHATCYAMIAYQTAYLKANYPAEYMCALMNSFVDVPEKLAAAVGECTRLGVPVLPPDINRSSVAFTVERLGRDSNTGKTVLGVRFGLSAIKNVGESALAGTLEARAEGGHFQSIDDFSRRADPRGLNKRALECLIKAGAFDQLGKRGALLAGLDRIMAAAQQQQKLRETGQGSMFDLWGDSAAIPMETIELPGGDVPVREKLAWEKELMGVYVSEHPFAAAASAANRDVTAFCGQIDEEMVGQSVVVAGIVGQVRQLVTRERRTFISAVIEDLEGSLEITVWPELYERTKELWVEGELVLVHGKVTNRRGVIQLTCEQVMQYSPSPNHDLDEGVEVAPAEPFDPAPSVPLSTAVFSEPDTEPSAFAEPELPVTAVAELPVAEMLTLTGVSIEDEASVELASLQVMRSSAPRPKIASASSTSNGNGNSNGSSNGSGAAPASNGAKARVLSIHLRETSDPERDLQKFQSVMQTFHRYQGRDAVRLTVYSGGFAVPLDLPGITVQACTNLMDELRGLGSEVDLIGEDY